MQERKQPETLRLRAVMPAITATDLQASLAWYRDVLGFIVAEEYKQEDRLMGVRLQAGSVQLMLGQDDFAKGRDRQKGAGLRFFCTTAQDVDQLAAAIKERGGKLAHEPTDQPWGTRDFGIVDPDGFNISISTEPKG
ncbi:MAG TPA: VOC family protein [Thermoanaerobaculia bacterium]|nr:VOC family protein [Thermoanaerobaculia bacterium]